MRGRGVDDRSLQPAHWCVNVQGAMVRAKHLPCPSSCGKACSERMAQGRVRRLRLVLPAQGKRAAKLQTNNTRERNCRTYV